MTPLFLLISFYPFSSFFPPFLHFPLSFSFFFFVEQVCVTPYETPDTVVNSSSNAVVWFHRNSNNATAWVESLLMQVKDGEGGRRRGERAGGRK